MAREVHYYDPTKLTIVGHDEEDESNPLHDERSAWEPDEAMIRNIMVYGIQLPVLVRKEAGIVYVVDGRQRVKAARAAQARQDEAGEFAIKVPCIEVAADDSRVSGIMISTNEVRKDDSVLAKARKAARLMDLLGSREEVALAFGRTTKTVDNWKKLMAADPLVHEAIESSKISATVGIELAAKPRVDQIRALDQLLNDSPATSNSKSEKKKLGDGDGAQKKEHAGVKKGWLRKAMKTGAYEALDHEQKAVLQWILSGHAPQTHWLEQFTWNADEEMGTVE